MHLLYDLFILIIILIPIHIIFSQPVYVRDLWMGEVAWFTTAYFVDPLVICNGGRLPINFLLETFSTLKEIQSKIFQELQRDTYGTGDRLLIQSGTPDNLISIPLTQAEADMTSDW